MKIVLMLVALRSTALGNAPSGSNADDRAPRGQGGRQGGSAGLTQRSNPLLLEMSADLGEGRAATRRGDLAEAERRYKDVVRISPDSPLGYGLLARLYDRMGRDREAFLMYRQALSDGYPFVSSMRQDPEPLARYGDLAARYGTIQEAKRSYSLAVAASDRDDVWEPRPVRRNPSFTSLKSAAHTAAAIQLWGSVSEKKALAELDVAVQADPDNWVARFYRARAYGRKQPGAAVREAAEAERLAPSSGKSMVRWMRATRRIPDLQGRFLSMPTVENGKSWRKPPIIPEAPATAKSLNPDEGRP